MPFDKPHLEFHPLNLEQGWRVPAGYKPGGVEEKILASDIDEVLKTGSRTRLLRFPPGGFSAKPFVHNHWEEVYLVSGELSVGSDEDGHGGEKFQAPTYACRPPGVWHGPFASETGCLLYEIHYYDETNPFKHEPSGR